MGDREVIETICNELTKRTLTLGELVSISVGQCTHFKMNTNFDYVIPSGLAITTVEIFYNNRIWECIFNGSSFSYGNFYYNYHKLMYTLFIKEYITAKIEYYDNDGRNGFNALNVVIAEMASLQCLSSLNRLFEICFSIDPYRTLKLYDDIFEDYQWRENHEVIALLLQIKQKFNNYWTDSELSL